MREETKILNGYKPNLLKLSEYGFVKDGEKYLFKKNILNGEFCFAVCIDKNGAQTEITDNATGEEYSPYYVNDCVGEFVKCVRDACAEILTDILNECFEKKPYLGSQVDAVLSYALEKYGSLPEFLWEDENSILRDKKSNKWYAALLVVEKRKIGIDETGVIEIINLKADQRTIPETVDGKNYFYAYHMNKKHWLSLRLDGKVPNEEIFKRIDDSFNLISKNATKRGKNVDE